MLIEILFGVSVFALIMIALTLLARNIFVYNSFISAGLTTADSSRNILKRFTAEVRTAGPAETGAYTIAVATPSAFTFYSDIDGDGAKERVRYFLEQGNLRKAVLKPSGSPLSYSGVETTTTLATHITNTDIFEYYDKYYDGDGSPLPMPIGIPNVRLVKITLVADQDPNRPPGPATFSTQVTMRNLKDNL